MRVRMFVIVAVAYQLTVCSITCILALTRDPGIIH